MASVGSRAFVRSAVLGVLATGCAAIAGLEEPDPIEAGDQGIMSPPPRAAVDSGAAAPADAAAPEAAPACTPQVTEIPAGTVHAQPWEGASPPSIDGKFDEWACVPRVELGPGDYTSVAYPPADKATFALRWTPAVLYVHAIVETTAPGYTSTARYLNDSISLFIGPPGTPSLAYRTNDYRLAFDHQGFTAAYRDTLDEPWPAGVSWKSASSTRDGVIVAEHEIAIEAVTLGVSAFTKGESYLFGLQISDRIGDLAQYRIWSRRAECGCTTSPTDCCYSGGKNHPSCDARCNGALVLD